MKLRALSAPLRRHLRDRALLRAAIVPMLALRHRPDLATDWIAFVVYHDVASGHRDRLAAQLRYMRSLGDFLPLDDAVGLLSRPRLGGRYFCVTFDDGRWGAYRHGLPVIEAASVPAAFFVVPEWVDREERRPDPSPRMFLTWDECRDLRSRNVAVGSHSMTHARLAMLGDEAVQAQLAASRRRIETELGQPCLHFACPWGQPDEDYQPARDPLAAERAGYRSFLTTIRGRAAAGTDKRAVPRVRLEPHWATPQLRYALFR